VFLRGFAAVLKGWNAQIFWPAPNVKKNDDFRRGFYATIADRIEFPEILQVSANIARRLPTQVVVSLDKRFAYSTFACTAW
jgi:hypothetical protein